MGDNRVTRRKPESVVVFTVYKILMAIANVTLWPKTSSFSPEFIDTLAFPLAKQGQAERILAITISQS